MAVNKYPAPCATCGHTVPKNGGLLRRVGSQWLVDHLACRDSGKPEVDVFTFSSGATITRNKRGLCEDAPCCGCCTG
ncbi:MAG TPA: hypothetical protein VFV82_04945 [Candidatus Binatia bacterium]|nr:hypothetical protein [Candidatus Binatia bacterium]